MAGWMFGYVLTTQVAFLVTTRVANAAGARVRQPAPAPGIAAYSNAWQLFQLPYAIVGISVITALLPRMSAHAAERRYRPGQGGLLHRRPARLGHRRARRAGAGRARARRWPRCCSGTATPRSPAPATWARSSRCSRLGLLPVHAVPAAAAGLLRDARQPHARRSSASSRWSINIAANLLALAILPPQHVVAGLGAGFGLANLAGTARRLAGAQPAARRPGRPGDRPAPAADARGGHPRRDLRHRRVGDGRRGHARRAGSPPWSRWRSAAAARCCSTCLFAKAFGVTRARRPDRRARQVPLTEPAAAAAGLIRAGDLDDFGSFGRL